MGRWASALFVSFGFFAADQAFCQHLSYGAISGTAVTNDYGDYVSTFTFPGFAKQVFIQEPAGRSLIGGPTLEWDFSKSFSIEGDAIFRELNFQNVGGSREGTVTWEIPVLAKYRFGYRGFNPFLEAGPSFRTTGNLNTNPTHVGLAAGAGVDFHIKKFHIAPTLRYTRWSAENQQYAIRSKPDQIEFLVGFSYQSGNVNRPFGSRLSAGAILGVSLLSDYTTSFYSGFVIDNNGQILPSSETDRSGSRGFAIGPDVDFRLSDIFSVEANAIHRPLHQVYVSNSTGVSTSGVSSAGIWQIPLLGKYKLPVALPAKLRPFAEAGPSFRVGSGLSHYGFTAGLGIARKVGKANLEPVMRYSRWPVGLYGVKPDELDLLVGVTF